MGSSAYDVTITAMSRPAPVGTSLPSWVDVFYLFPLTFLSPTYFLWPLHSSLTSHHNSTIPCVLIQKSTSMSFLSGTTGSDTATRADGHHYTVACFANDAEYPSLCVSYSVLSLERVCFQCVVVASKEFTSTIRSSVSDTASVHVNVEEVLIACSRRTNLAILVWHRKGT